MAGILDRIESRIEVRASEEERAIGGVPWRPWDDPYWRFDVGGPVHPHRAVGGQAGVDAALSLTPVYGAVNFLANGVAMIPLKQYRSVGNDTQRMPLGQLLNKPSAFINRFQWLYQYVSSAALWGTAFGYITTRDAYSFPTTIEWLPPDKMVVVDDKDNNPAKAKFFFAGNEIPRESLFLVPAFSIAGRAAGISPLKAFALTIESGLNMGDYADGWFKNGGFPPGVLKNTQYEMVDEQAEKMRKKLVTVQQRRQPLVVGMDWEYSPIVVPPEEAQFVQSAQLNATQIAVIYGVSPKRVGGMTGDSMTYSNAEQAALEEQQDSLDAWLVRLETALEDALPGNQYARFDRDSRLRMTTPERWGVYQIARNIGGMSVNDIHEREHMEKLPAVPKADQNQPYDGDDYTPLQLQIAINRGLAGQLAEATAKGGNPSDKQPPVSDKHEDENDNTPGNGPE